MEGESDIVLLMGWAMMGLLIIQFAILIILVKYQCSIVRLRLPPMMAYIIMDCGLME